jgi:hypothetical protein
MVISFGRDRSSVGPVFKGNMNPWGTPPSVALDLYSKPHPSQFFLMDEAHSALRADNCLLEYHVFTFPAGFHFALY